MGEYYKQEHEFSLLDEEFYSKVRDIIDRGEINLINELISVIDAFNAGKNI